jgi:hypothetical protein
MNAETMARDQFDALDIQRQTRLLPEAATYRDSMLRAAEHGCEYLRRCEWSALPQCDDPARIGHIAARYIKLAALEDEQERRERIEAMAREELSWDDSTLRAFTLARLRAWILMALNDPGAVRTVAGSYDAVFARLPGEMEFRRATAVQAVFQTEVSPGGQHLLLELVPGMKRFATEHRRMLSDAKPSAPRVGFWKRVTRGGKPAQPESV